MLTQTSTHLEASQHIDLHLIGVWNSWS